MVENQVVVVVVAVGLDPLAHKMLVVVPDEVVVVAVAAAAAAVAVAMVY